MTLIDYYLDKQIEYEKKYGDKTLVLMEVGVSLNSMDIQ